MDGAVVVVVDNGGYTCKAGFAGDEDPIAVIPNCVFRTKSSKKPFIADQIESCNDFEGLSIRRPFDRGYVVNWDLQKDVFEHIFNSILGIKTSDCELLLTEPLFNPPSIQTIMAEIVFEEFGFKSFCTRSPASLTHLYYSSTHPESLVSQSSCSVVVDCGFSFTHSVPCINNKPVLSAVKRLNVGGKALTNYLKETITYRSWNVESFTNLIDDVKEKLCLCTLNLNRDLSIARELDRNKNYFYCQYVLPDGVKHKLGYIKDVSTSEKALIKTQEYYISKHLENEVEPIMEKDENKYQRRDQYDMKDTPSHYRNSDIEEMIQETNSKSGSLKDGDKVGREEDTDQILELTNERFMAPEALFRPSELGLNQCGLAECILNSINQCPSFFHPTLFSNILLTGGSSLFPFFKERLEMELRPLVPSHFPLRIECIKNPILSAWRGASLLAASPQFHNQKLTRSEYLESGSSLYRFE